MFPPVDTINLDAECEKWMKRHSLLILICVILSGNGVALLTGYPIYINICGDKDYIQWEKRKKCSEKYSTLFKKIVAVIITFQYIASILLVIVQLYYIALALFLSGCVNVFTQYFTKKRDNYHMRLYQIIPAAKKISKSIGFKVSS